MGKIKEVPECIKCLWYDGYALRIGKNHCTYPSGPRQDESGNCYYFCLYLRDPGRDAWENKSKGEENEE